MKIYAISGLGADQRVFSYLTLNCDLVPIEWIDPLENESLKDFALRLSDQINHQEPFIILGVSFGGIIATEISKSLDPKLTILVSSIETSSELPSIYKLFGSTGMVHLIPKWFFKPPRKIAHWFFGAKDKVLLNQILDEASLSFTKWSVNALLKWRSTERIKNRTLKVGGNNDRLLPQRNLPGIRLIEDAGHFMIVDRASEISAIINEEIHKL